MSIPKPADAVKLIVSILAVDSGQLNGVLQRLCNFYGVPDVVGPPLAFHYTDYYSPEMGTTLIRRFIAFQRFIRPESLPDIKIVTNVLEEKQMEEGRRKVNLDPGYISLAHLVLATGKGYTHRPYLRKGIYADLTLLFQDKTFRSLPWTYPDYAAPSMIHFFNEIRRRYITQMRQGEGKNLQEAF
ncbi:MAG: DUF4416 family protein [Deltaproteobacteria bacterium]|nr:DUF4416 family protein [Deltaproteobacteria bacterium]